MGANRRQGWALFLFLVGFTFLPAGLLSLGPLFSFVGLLCLIASAVMFTAIRPLEHGHSHDKPEAFSVPAKKKQAV
jgi:hypothetical protein